MSGHDAHAKPIRLRDALPKTMTEWNVRRTSILKNMQEVMGPLPGEDKRIDLDVQVEEEVDCGSYIRRLITYASEPGSRTPAYLCIPKNALDEGATVPAVLCLHPTDNQVGHGVVVGLSSKVNRSYAAELAERGFVTLAPSYPWLANYEPDLDGLGYQSGTMKAIWDNIRGLDLLDELPYVKHGSYGAIGHSLGGHNSLYTAVFEPRIKAVVTSCGFDAFEDYKGGDITGWTSIRYMPKLKEYALDEIPFDFDDVLAAIAPRPCFISAPLHDTNFQWQSVDKLVDAARQVYALYDAADDLRVVHPDCDHDFPNESREEAYRLFASSL